MRPMSTATTPATCECNGRGYLLDQEYGTADIPADWTPVQACDLCRRYDTDDDAAMAAGADTGATAVAYFMARPDEDDEAWPEPGDFAIELKGA